jgi:hypothetical protein
MLIILFIFTFEFKFIKTISGNVLDMMGIVRASFVEIAKGEDNLDILHHKYNCEIVLSSFISIVNRCEINKWNGHCIEPMATPT